LGLKFKLLVFPMAALVLAFLISGQLISRRIERSLMDNENGHIAQMSGMLDEVYRNQTRELATSMKVAVLQPELYDAYFAALMDDDLERLKRFLTSTVDRAQVDDALVVDDSGEVMVRAMSEEQGLAAPVQEPLAPVLDHDPITDRQKQLGDVVRTHVVQHGDGFQVLTVGPVLDVETVVGALVFVKKLDGDFLALQKNYFPENAEISIATAESLSVSTLPGWSLPRPLIDGENTFDLTIDNRPFRHRFVPLEGSRAFLGLSYDTTENRTARSAIRTLMAVIFLIALGLVVAIVTLNSTRVVRSVNQLAGYTGHIARGDLSATVDDLGGDEVGRMARMFNEMVASLKRIAGKLGAATGDLVDHSDGLSRVTENLHQIARWKESPASSPSSARQPS
jgi:nitrogen fixation/metabolism regulation signal transduction histidine kinase